MLNLQKGESLTLDLNKVDSKRIDVGLGWDTRCDLDAHAILRDASGKMLKIVYFGNKSAMGVRLSGDNTTGAGAGDDEIIYLDLDKIDKKVKIISIYVNVYSSGKTFGNVKGSYVRLYNPETKKELAKAKLEDTSLDKYKTVHYADITLTDKLDFKIIMNGSMDEPDVMRYVVNAIDNPVTEPTVVATVTTPVEEPKKKRFFGLF